MNVSAGDDPWTILGVSREAAPVEIKFAFRKAAMEFHPDKQTTEEDKKAANAIFAKLSAAYEVLSDPVKTSKWKIAEDQRNKAKAQKSSASASHAKPPGAGGSLHGSSHKPRPSGTSSAMAGGSNHRSHPPQGKPAAGKGGAGSVSSTQAVAPHTRKNTTPRAPGSAAAAANASKDAARHHHAAQQQAKPQPQVIVQLYRDPFEIFDKVMKEEFGDDYKQKSDDWKKSKGASNLSQINPFTKRNENSRKEFKKLDVDGDKTLSKGELGKYIQSHSDLWSSMGMMLSMPVYKCVEIATNVAFVLALKKQDSMVVPQDRDLTEAEFKYFHQHFVLNEKGAQEFFLRTIFSAFDLNKDGVLSARELDRFLDIFYKARDVFKGEMRLPDRKSLNQIVRGRLDKNHDNHLQFNEIRDLLQVAAVVTADKMDQ